MQLIGHQDHMEINPFDGKPVAIMSASIGMSGGTSPVPSTSDVCIFEYVSDKQTRDNSFIRSR
jgi:hypothetical protein